MKLSSLNIAQNCFTDDFSVCENSVNISVDKKNFPNDWMLDRIKSVNPYFVILISSMSVIVAQRVLTINIRGSNI